jgi:hypothetical protein
MARRRSHRSLASLLAAWGCLGVSGSAAAADSTVRCTCPTVRADGFGATACSANESAGRCRVEFNQFPDDAVQAAASALRRSGETLVPLLRARDEASPAFYSRLAALDEDARARAVLVYIGVAAARDERWDKASSDALVAAVLRDAPARRRVAEAFGRAALESGAAGGAAAGALDPQPRGAGAYGSPGRPRDEIDTAPGCVAVKAGADWYMYKAPWSPARALPQCSAR